MADLQAIIQDNLLRVRERLAAAARRAGREADEITLVGVTKYVDSQAARALLSAGCGDLGESRPQELWHKAADLAGTSARWHLVGHLQRNKVRRTLPLVALLHSGDSLRLLAEVDRVAAELQVRVPVLLEVNISGDAAKHGFAPSEVRAALPEAAALAHLHIRGLMAMASLEGSLDDARREFRGLRELRDALRADCPATVQLDDLSMGMSGDFEVAIEEGATIVRVGSALFEGIVS